MRKLLLICIVLAVGCSQKQATPVEYLAYIDNPENKLIAKEEIGNFRISAQYRPWEYEAIHAAGVGNAAELKSALNEPDSMQYFLLRLESVDGHSDVLSIGAADEAVYNQRVQYLSSSIPQDIYLVDGQDTLSCVAHHWERSYHITHFNNIILVFENKHPDHKNNKTFVFDDPVFGMGKVQLMIKQQDISSIPSITL